MNTLELVKDGHRYVFRYEVGEESAVLDVLKGLAMRHDVPLDWFDAAVLSRQLGEHLAVELKKYAVKKSA